MSPLFFMRYRRARPLWQDRYRAWFADRYPHWRRMGGRTYSRPAQQRRAIAQRLNPGRLEYLQRRNAALVLQRLYRSRRWRRAALEWRLREPIPGSARDLSRRGARSAPPEELFVPPYE